MEISERIETRKDVKAIAFRLVGNYQKVNYMEAWSALVAYCRKHHIDNDCPEAEYINIYHDNRPQLRQRLVARMFALWLQLWNG